MGLSSIHPSPTVFTLFAPPPTSGCNAPLPLFFFIRKHLAFSRCLLPREAPRSSAKVSGAPRTSEPPNKRDPRHMILALGSTLFNLRKQS